MPHDTNAQPVPPNQPKQGATQQPMPPPAGNGTGVAAIPYLSASPYVQPMFLPGMTQGGAGGATAAINSAGMIKAFRKRWTVAIVLGLVCGGIAAAATWFAMPPSRYSGEVIFNIDSSQPLLPTTMGRTEWINHQRVQQALVTSQGVLETAAADPRVAERNIIKRHGPNPVEWLAKELKADYQMGPDLLHITLKEDNRDDLVALMGAIADAYLARAQASTQKTIDDNTKILKDAAKKYDDQLKQLRIDRDNAILSSPLKNAGEDPRAARDFDRASALEARNQLTRLEDEIHKTELEVARLKQVPPAVTISGAAIERLKDGQVDAYLHDIARLTPLVEDRKKIRGYRRDPQYRDLQRQLDEANRGLTARRKELWETANQELQAQAARKAKQDLAAATAKLETLNRNRPALEEKVKDLRKKAVSAAAGKVAESPNVIKYKRQIEEVEGNANRVRKQLAQLELVRDNPPRVTKFDKPYTLPTNDIKIMIAATAAAGVVVFCIFAFGISWMEFRLRRIDTADELVQQVGLPLVGTIPEFNARPRALSYGRRNDVPAQVEQSVLAESIDTIRTMLLHAARSESLRTVMIASAASREGKTTLACQLATSLARAGRKTLLIDGDLRKPMLHDLYSAGRAPGLAEVLRGELGAVDAVRQTFVPDLWLMAAGQAEARAIQALSHEQFRRHLQRLREEFDFIVVDSSPVLSAVEPLLLAQQVDTVVFSVLLDVSQVPPVQTAYRRLQSLGVRILGAVVSGTDISPHSYEFGAYAYGNMAETAGAAGSQP